MSTVIQGDCLEVLRTLDAGSIDSMVTDPPAGISFMGKGWDSDKGGRDKWIAWLAEIMREALRVLRPGAHALVWAIPRTSHWTATALEDAGFEIRDVVSHHFGSGFPKSLDVSKAIDASKGAEREVVGPNPHARPIDGAGGGYTGPTGHDPNITAPATTEAKQWDGWGTALKPATEHWILARKPLGQTVAACVLEHGTGGINVEGCRVGTGTGKPQPEKKPNYKNAVYGKGMGGAEWENTSGRWPTNLLLTHANLCTDAACVPCCPVREIGEQSGEGTSGSRKAGNHARVGYHGDKGGVMPPIVGDTGTAARFFPTFRYTAKPSTAEREQGVEHKAKQSAGELTGGRKEGSAGLDNPRAGAGRTSSGRANTHPTVKPIALMQWLCRLITPPKGTVLDPFCGSGTTGIAALREGFEFTGIELAKEYADIARARIVGDAPLFNRGIE